MRSSAFVICIHAAGVLVTWGWDESKQDRVVVGLYLFHVAHISVVYCFIDTERK